MSTVDIAEARRELESLAARSAFGEPPDWTDVARVLARAGLVLDELAARRELDVAGWLRLRAHELRRPCDDDGADAMRGKATKAMALDEAARAWEEEHG